MTTASDHLLVLPGGGYAQLSPSEAEPIVDWLTGLGLRATVFSYPFSNGHPGVVDAIHDEVRRVRRAGAERVGLVGFSAGGHAAGLAALTAHAPSERVDLVILGYPVVSMVLDTHQGSRINLLGENADEEVRAITSLELLVTPEAPPFFIWHTAADGVVPVEHSYRLAGALAEAAIAHAVHVFPRGKHGLALATGTGTAEAWTTLCEAWLREAGWLAPSVAPEIFAIRTVLQEGAADDYGRIHGRTPLELDDELRRLGVVGWEIWRDGLHLFHRISVTDRAAFSAGLASSEIHRAWGDRMARLLERDGEARPLEPVWTLPSSVA